MKKQLILTIPLIVALCAAHALAADTSNVEARLSQLEQTVASLKKENQDLKSQLGVDGKSAPVFVKPAGKETSMKLGGYLQGQAEFGDSPDARFTGLNDRFLVRRARISVAGNFAENFDFKVEADFGANTMSAKSGFSAQLTDVYLNWNRYPFANVKFGQFKTPFGYEQLVADTKLITIERSLSNDRLTDSRQLGIGVSGDFLQKRLGYSIGAFNGTGINISSNDNKSFMFAGRLTGVPVKFKLAKEDFIWSIGVDGLFTQDHSVAKSGFGFDSVPGGSKDSIFSGKRESWGVDSQLKWSRFGLEGEYLHSHFEPTDHLPAGSFDADGWYVMGTCFILPQKLQALAKYEHFDPNTMIKKNDSEIYTLGLVYYLKGDDLKFSLNYLLGNQAGAPAHQARLLARAQVVF